MSQHADIPEEPPKSRDQEVQVALKLVVGHIKDLHSTHELLMLCAVEFSHSPQNRVHPSQVTMLQVFFNRMVAEGHNCVDIVLKVVCEVSGKDASCVTARGFARLYKLYRHSENVLFSMNSTYLDELFQRLDQTGNEACTFFSVLLAVSQSQWDYVITAIQDRNLLIRYGGMEIFCSVLGSRAWHCAAVILESLVRADMPHSTMPETSELIEKKFEHCPNEVYKKVIVPSFFKACQAGHLPRAGAVFAIWNDKLAAARRFLVKPMDNSSLRRLVQLFIDFAVPVFYRYLLDVIMAHSDLDTKVIVLRALGKAARLHKFNYETHIVTVTQLLDGVTDEKSLQLILYYIVLHHKVQTFKRFIAKDLLKYTHFKTTRNSLLLQAVVSLGLAIVHQKVSQKPMFGWKVEGEVRYQKARRILTLCMEAGLTTLSPPDTEDPNPMELDSTPLGTAAACGMLDVVELLHKTGATTNRELSALSSDPYGKDLLGLRRKGYSRVQSYLANAASSVQSLQSLCAFRVSRSIGCGPDRKQRALQLPLPMNQVQAVLFNDVLYTEQSLFGSETLETSKEGKD